MNFVENGGRLTEAAHVFRIGIASIYRWLSRTKLEATKVK
ncbi:transposase, partial [Trichodesmium erythraeum 21-75]|nr:transposase [Trichodesmium erythraeum 21-75]